MSHTHRLANLANLANLAKAMRAIALAGLGYFTATAPSLAATLTLDGARFDAPSYCKLAEGALVCTLDGQQLEIWVVRKPLAPSITPTDSFARRAAHFDGTHLAAVSRIKRDTGNTESRTFSNYGRYSALGADMPGKGAVAAPAVRLASVLHGDEIWEFLEVVATRTPALEALSTELQRSLQLPVLASAAAAPSAAAPVQKETSSTTLASIDAALLSLQFPRFLEPADRVDTTDRFGVTLKHRTRENGPNGSVNFRATVANQTATSWVADRRNAALSAGTLSPGGLIALSKLGSISGVGYVLVSTPLQKNSKDGKPGVETIEALFAAQVGGRMLIVQFNAEQQHASELEAAWGALAGSIKIK
jgi:hypothetical protein